MARPMALRKRDARPAGPLSTRPTGPRSNDTRDDFSSSQGQTRLAISIKSGMTDWRKNRARPVRDLYGSLVTYFRKTSFFSRFSRCPLQLPSASPRSRDMIKKRTKTHTLVSSRLSEPPFNVARRLRTPSPWKSSRGTTTPTSFLSHRHRHRLHRPARSVPREPRPYPRRRRRRSKRPRPARR